MSATGSSDARGPMDAAEKLARLKELRADSGQKLQALARQGVGDLGMGHMRTEMLIEALWPWEDGTNEVRIDFELTWEEKANEVLTQVTDQVGRAKLLQGVTMPPNGR
jgi:hypothetical protein